ncbi:MAG: hypothetical protein OHK0036_11300 [Bacteroidia bacterium]
MSKENKRKLFLFILLIVVVVLMIYLFTYFLNKEDNRVIYEGQGKRIYLTKKLQYKDGRVMYNLVLEEKATGERFFVLANTPKNFKEKYLADRILNTYNQGRMKSYDAVERVGLTIKKINSDIHSNLVQKKSSNDVLNDLKKVGEKIIA